MKHLRLSHMINPVKVGPESDLYLAQPITFTTLIQARAAAPPEISIDLLATGFPEDLEGLPEEIQATPPLERSIRDLPGFNESHRPLPLLADILERQMAASAADILIYSNVDIAVLPEFYRVVHQYLREGLDAFVINRRTIPENFTSPRQIREMIAQTRTASTPHPGYDCFVFRRQAAERFVLGNACIGANWSGRILLANLIRFSRKFKEFKDLRITFHIGDRRDWNLREHNPYNQHNAEMLSQTLDRLIRGAGSSSKNRLQSMRDMISGDTSMELSLLADLAEQHTLDREFSIPPKQIFPGEFRSSSSWERLPRQFLRQDPVFIVGYPRSGTTLFQSLLATQPGLVTFPETHFFSIVRNAMVVENDRISPSCLDRVFAHIRQRVEFSIQAETHARQTAASIGLSPKMLFETMVIDILSGRIPTEKISGLRWLEKTPDHIHFLDVILRFYPAARIICVLRDPEQAILSRRQHFRFKREFEWPIERHAREWLRGIRSVSDLKRREPEAVHILRLEDLSRNPRAAISETCQFLGIEFDPNALAEYREKAESLTYPWETWKSGVFQAISPDIANRRNRRFSWRQRTVLDFHAGGMMAKYGYGNLPRRIFAAAIHVCRWFKKQAINPDRPARPRYKPDTSPGVWPRKIDLGDQAEGFYGKHRCGWTFAIKCLKPLHTSGGVLLDSFIERTFAWSHQRTIHTRPWVGFIHVPPNVPAWFQSHQSNDDIFASEAWQRSLPYCRGLFTLSDYHRRHLEPRLNIPINHLYFPTEIPAERWSWERFQANSRPGVVQVGWWLRRIHAIFQLSTAGTPFRKIFLKVNYFDWDDLILRERKILEARGEFEAGMYAGTDTVQYLPNNQYDRLLSENVVFLNLYDSSANNTIIECMSRATPILVNPLESVREYLGDDYPLYYKSLGEATEILGDPERILAAHRYLDSEEIRDRLRPERFLNDFAQSNIYRNL